MKNNNLLIGYKHDKKIYVIERFIMSNYERGLSHVYGYTRTLDLIWMRKELFLGTLYFKI
jgi:hypothetical protein